MPAVPVLRRLRQEDPEFKVSLSNKHSVTLPQKKRNKCNYWLPQKPETGEGRERSKPALVRTGHSKASLVFSPRCSPKLCKP
jgi:hypothetical protein